MINPIIFHHADRQLTVKATMDNSGYSVRVYDGDKQVTGFVYTVSYETQLFGGKQDIPVNLVQHLMELAKSDVEMGIVKLLP